MSKNTKSMVGGMTVLGITGVVCKLVGVLFSIPLSWIIGTDGLGIFQAVFPTYNLLLTVSSAGLPVAVSRMVSHYITRDQPKSAKTVFRIALSLLASIGCVASIIMLCASGMLAQNVKQPESITGFQVIAPCVAIVCILAAFRGFMQGQQNMVPTAISQLIEQVGKVSISLPLAWFGMQRSVALGAAGALLGITIVEMLALLYMMIQYKQKQSEFALLPQKQDEPLPKGTAIARQLIFISIPITVSACIVPLAQFVDSIMMVDRMMTAGLAYEQARPLYGIFTGMVIRLINIPTALALSISMSLVPAVASAVAAQNKEGIQHQSDLGLRFAFLIGFPCSIGMSILAKQIMSFFYSSTLTATELQTASDLLTVSSLTVVLFTVVQATSAILQGLHKQKIPMYTLIIGVGLKILMNYILIGTPGIDIHGGPIASIICYSASMIPNLYFVVHYTGLRFQWKNWLLRPGAAAGCMGLVVWGLRELLPTTRWATMLEILVGVTIYGTCALLFQAIKKEDFAFLKHRKKVVKQ